MLNNAAYHTNVEVDDPCRGQGQFTSFYGFEGREGVPHGISCRICHGIFRSHGVLWMTLMISWVSMRNRVVMNVICG